jgi:hypothetical protein
VAIKTRTSAEVKNRYNAKAYDRILIVVPKGEKELITAHAKAHGESTNAFIKRAIDETIKRDKEKDTN